MTRTACRTLNNRSAGAYPGFFCFRRYMMKIQIESNLIRYLLRNASWWERILSVAGGLLLIYPGIVTDVIGLALVGLVVVILLFEKRRDKKLCAQ